MNKQTTNIKRKLNSFVLAIFLAVSFAFPLSASSQTVMEWMVLSIMRAQSVQNGGDAGNLWQAIIDTGENATIFQSSK